MKRAVLPACLFLMTTALSAHEADVRPVPPGRTGETALETIAGAQESVDVFLYSFAPRANQPDALPFRLVEALKDAQARGARVRVVLDRGPGPDGPGADPEARNAAARDLLAGGGVPVFLDDPGVATHAKVLIVDGETVLLGSSNWTAAAFHRNVEADVLVRSRPFARDLLAQLDRALPPAAPAPVPVEVPWDFLARPDLLGRMVTRRDERAFDAMLYLFKAAPAGEEFELDTREAAEALGLARMTREAYRRQLHKTLVKLRDDYGLLRLTQGFNREPRVALLLPTASPGAVPVPPAYWDLGWSRRLSFPGKVFYLWGLHYSAASPDRPRWTVPGDVLADRHGVSRAFVSQGVVALRRAGLVEVQYGELKREGGPRDASVYTPAPLYDPQALERRFAALLEKHGPAKLARARRYAALVYDDADASGVERLIQLEDEHGPARLKRAAAKLAAKDPGNPRRTLGYLIGIVRNPD